MSDADSYENIPDPNYLDEPTLETDTLCIAIAYSGHTRSLRFLTGRFAVIDRRGEAVRFPVKDSPTMAVMQIYEANGVHFPRKGRMMMSEIIESPDRHLYHLGVELASTEQLRIVSDVGVPF